MTLKNGSWRQISNVAVNATTATGHSISDSFVEFLQSKWDQSFQFDLVDEARGRFASGRPVVDVPVTLTFEDIDETKWVLGSNGRLLRFARLGRWRGREGHRHSTAPRSRP